LYTMGGGHCSCTCARPITVPEGEDDVLGTSQCAPLGIPAASPRLLGSGGLDAADEEQIAADGATRAGVPPLHNWFHTLQRKGQTESGQDREVLQDTPRFNDLLASPQQTGPPSAQTPKESPRPGSEEMIAGARAMEVFYEGPYLGKMKHGRGKLQMTECTYIGDFWHDQRHGQGELRWDDGRVYKGQFENSKFHGFAAMTWIDGRSYAGAYADDRKHGEGTFVWTDGRRYAGQWDAGKRHGIGVYTNAKGLTRRGTWAMDRPVEWEPPEPVSAMEEKAEVADQNVSGL